MGPFSTLVHKEIRHFLTVGIYTRDIIIEEVVYSVSNLRNPRAARKVVPPTVDKLWLEQLESQKSWDKITDYDLLDAAFLKLDSEGIVARHNFDYTLTSGTYEISLIAYERNEAHKNDGRGWCFYTSQSVERAVKKGYLTLAYGSVIQTKEAVTLIAKEIVSAVKNEGLEVEWDNDPNMPIIVKLNWQKRLGPLPLRLVKT